MQTAELVAGQELDALVAEKVMGMTNVELRLHVQGEDLFGERDGFTEWGPAYSTEIAAAWQVVEKMQIAVVPDGDGWLAAQTDIQSLGFTFDLIEWKYADTAPLAICRAALAAVGH